MIYFHHMHCLQLQVYLGHTDLSLFGLEMHLPVHQQRPRRITGRTTQMPCFLTHFCPLTLSRTFRNHLPTTSRFAQGQRLSQLGKILLHTLYEGATPSQNRFVVQGANIPVHPELNLLPLARVMHHILSAMTARYGVL